MAAFFILPRLPSSREGGRWGKEGQGGRRHQLVLELIVGLGWVGFGLAAVLVGFPCLVVQYRWERQA
jgi:hypothetical protein